MNALAPLGASWPAPLQLSSPVSHVRDIRGVVDRTLARARAAGRDLSTQWLAAAHAVVAVRPDLSFADALRAVRRLQDLEAV